MYIHTHIYYIQYIQSCEVQVIYTRINSVTLMNNIVFYYINPRIWINWMVNCSNIRPSARCALQMWWLLASMDELE